jgi:F0F1-type ATP synthase membrane subunit c/vacuolar-type H+-ATPase subunit K
LYYISLRFAWISIALLIFTALKYIARKSGNYSLNRFFRKYHILSGILMIITGLLHGIFAGNDINSTFEDMQIAPKLFTLNLGTACFIITLFLWTTYLLRRQLKKRWIIFHRILTALLILLTVLHVYSNL